MIRWWRRLIWPSADPKRLGRRGEAAAARWLRRRGYRILDRNVSCGDDELDIVALDPDGVTIAIVEVKTRASAHPPPEASVGRTKQYRLARCAAKLSQRRRYQRCPMRFDVIAVIWPPDAPKQITHWPAAFESPL
jgi:putative endonuclease